MQVVTECYDARCVGSLSRFCACWIQGMDLDPETCVCVPRDLAAVCEPTNLMLIDPANYNCDAAMGYVESLCY